MRLSNVDFVSAEKRHEGGTFLGFASFTFEGEVAEPGLAPFVAKTFISGVAVFLTNAGKLILNFPIRQEGEEKYDVAAPATAETRAWLTGVIAGYHVVKNRVAEIMASAQPAQAPMAPAAQPNAAVDALAAQVAQLTQLVLAMAGQKQQA